MTEDDIPEDAPEGQLAVSAPRFTNLDDEQIVRLHLYDGFGVSGDVKGEDQVKTLDMMFRWVMHGDLPPEEPKSKTKLKVVT